MKKVIYIIISFLLVSCGGNPENSTPNSTSKKETKKAIKSNTIEDKKEVIEIIIIAKGESMTGIAFEPKTFTIPKNSRIKITLKNESVMAGMLHNFVLVALGSGQEIATAGISSGKANDFVPNDDRVIVYTKVLDMGEETTIEFDSPEVGSYHYICTFPGHYPNMIGRMNVQ